jgi:hypothetical protein
MSQAWSPPFDEVGATLLEVDKQTPYASGEPRPIAAATQERRLLGVGSTAMILIEAPSSADRRGLLALGKHQPPQEEETFYVATDVKLFLSALRAGRSLPLSIPNDLAGWRPC